MGITRYVYDPLTTTLVDFQRDINRLFNRHLNNKTDNSNVETSQWSPLVDIQEQSDKFVLLADIPGVALEDIEIAMEDNILTLKGQRETPAAKQEGEWSRVERSMGTFYRRFNLPDTADLEKIKAQGQNGVIEITIPKRDKSQPKRIRVEQR